MVVNPKHLVMNGGAIKEQTPLLAQIKQTTPNEKIVTRSSLVSPVGILKSGLIDRGTGRHDGYGLADLGEKTFGFLAIQESQASLHRGGKVRAGRTENAGERKARIC